jgi:NAD(P)H-flavin reductase
MFMAQSPETLGVGVAVDVMLPRIARVRRLRLDGPETWTLDVEDEGNTRSFVPGQFNMMTAFGVGEIPISFSGDPSNAECVTHTVRAVGQVSAALTRLEPGDVLGLRGPFGTGWPMAEIAGRDVVIVAGGLGLAPLRPVLYQLLAQRDRYGNVALLYGTRSPEDVLYHQELESWGGRSDFEVDMTVDHATTTWHGHVGVVTTLVPHATFDPITAIAFVCGPEIMMRFAIGALRDAGVADEAIYLSMERNMKCAVGFCGHCQFGSLFVCRDGPVFRYDRVRTLLGVKEL